MALNIKPVLSLRRRLKIKTGALQRGMHFVRSKMVAFLTEVILKLVRVTAQSTRKSYL